jgi:CRP-like cAMP-binding protein
MKKSLQSIMPPARAEELIAIGERQKLNPQQYFIRAGEVPKKFAFVVAGLFRYVYINEQGQEFTKGIIREHNFISSYSAMIAASPSNFFIEALEKAEVLTIPYAQWQLLLKRDIFWTQFLLSAVEQGFIIKERREHDLLMLNAETRYRNFLREYPDVENRVSQATIASYLGIKPESLSRIRKKLAT